MDRQIPDIFDVFAIGSPPVTEKPRGGVALPGLTRTREECSWAPRLHIQLSKWIAGRTDPGERPRTYDRFYQKLPGNYQEPQTESCLSIASSESEDQKRDKRKTRKKGRSGNRREDVHYSKTLTEHDIKHIERHLSMKRTIRKKIMRDLQQAFLQDPKQLDRNKREIGYGISCSTNTAAKLHGQSEPNILDMLRDSSDDSGSGWSPLREQKFRSVRDRRRRNSCLTSSSEDLSCDWTESEIGESRGELGMKMTRGKEREDDIDKNMDRLTLDEPSPDYDQEDLSRDRKTFWQRLVGRAERRRP